jgi:hypothetical protein
MWLRSYCRLDNSTSSEWTLSRSSIAQASPSVRLATWRWKYLDEFQISDSLTGCGSSRTFIKRWQYAWSQAYFWMRGQPQLSMSWIIGHFSGISCSLFYCNRVLENKLSASNVENRSGPPLDSIPRSPHHWIIGASCDYWQSYSRIS